MRSLGRSRLLSRGKVLVAPNAKKLAALSCLELRKEIQDSARRYLRSKAVWTQYVTEVCKRIQRNAEAEQKDEVDRFTPTDVSLIFAAFAAARKRFPGFINFLLEAARPEISKYELRDFAVLYNGLAKLDVQADDMINGFSDVIEAKLNAKTSEKDIALLLNALLELDVRNVNGIFVRASLVISSRIRYIANCHTLTLLLHSYSRFRGFINDAAGAAGGTGGDGEPGSQPREGHIGASDPPLPDSYPDAGKIQADFVGKDGEVATVQSPEATLISDTSISLLSRCVDLTMKMRPTDLLYFYRAALNLIYNNSEGVTQHLYASMVNIHKAHIRIREHLLEFDARELITLLEVLRNVQDTVEARHSPAGGDDDGALWVVSNEVRSKAPALREEVVNELAYRVRVMSFAECLGFIKLMEPDDHRGLLVCRRLTYKLNKQDSWERYLKADLWELAHCLARRAELADSADAQQLVIAITKKISGTLKLREVDWMCALAARLGTKTNALLKKAMSVHCRADCLLPSQAASLLYHLTGLGYIDHLGPIMQASANVDSAADALNVLAAMAILKVNGLVTPPEHILQRAKGQLADGGHATPPADERAANKIAFVRAAGLVDEETRAEKYCVYPRMYAGNQYVTLRAVQLARNSRLKTDYQVMTLPQCTDDIAQSMQEFVEKFDTQSTIHRQYDAGDMVVPIVFETPGTGGEPGHKVAVHVLLNDFYAGGRQMLRIDVYAQLKLMQQRGLRTVCCRAEEYANGDRTQFIANLLERCHAAAAAADGEGDGAARARDVQQRPEPTEKLNELNPIRPRLDSFSRLRLLVTEGRAAAQEAR